MRTVIVAGKRSPIGRFLGGLSTISATDLGAQVASAMLDELKVDRKLIDEVFIGNVLQAGVGQSPARQVALKAGLPHTVTVCTLNKVCGSSLEAAIQGDRAIRCGDDHVVLAGGIEMMSRAPHLLPNSRVGSKYGSIEMVDHIAGDGLNCAFEKWPMGCAADYTAKKYNISRADLDAFALRSHQRAVAAMKAGHFKSSIVPINAGKKTVDTDETPRPDTTAESLAGLKPVFAADGTSTAGNSSPLSDGAAMLLLASEQAAKKHGWKARAEILAAGTAGEAPKDLFIAPVAAVRQVVEKAGLKLSDIDLFEINEAFASQSVACIRLLEIDENKVNVNGGAIALGHPIGASGARVLVTLLDNLEQRNLKTGVASLCLGGGNAVAMVVRR